MIKNLVKPQIKNANLFSIIIVILMGLFFVLASNVQLDTQLSSMIPDDGEYNSNKDLMSASFNTGEALLIILKLDQTTTLTNAITDIKDDEVTNHIQKVKEILEQSQYYRSTTPVQYDSIYAQFAVMVETPDRIGGASDVKAELEHLIAQTAPPPGVSVTLTGFPLLIDKIGSLLIIDNITTIALTLIFILGFLYWYFRSIRFVIAVTLSPVVSLIILAGAMAFFGIHITIPLAAVGVLVLGLGVDYSIHIATHYHEERKTKNHQESLITSIKELSIPITASFFTTLAGFMALTLGVSPSTQSQGIVLSLAIAIIYSVSFTVFPVFVTSIAKNATIKENQTFIKIKKGLAKLAVYQANHPRIVLLIFSIVTIFMFGGLSQVAFSTSNSNWIPDSDPISTSFRESEYTFGKIDSIIIILHSNNADLRQVQTAKDVRKIEELIKNIPNVDSVNSAFSTVNYDTATLYDELTYQKDAYFNEDYTVSTIKIDTHDINEDAAGKSLVLKEIRDIVNTYPIHDADTSLYGDTVQFEELMESMQADTMITTIIGIILVLLIASIIYASLKVGLIALVPIIIGLIWAIGLMGYLGVPFTSLSTGIVSLVLGIGIDFSIHLVDSIKKYLKKFEFEVALHKALISSGTSILLASATTFIGFMALSFSQLLGTRRLGWSLAIAVVAVFIVSIIIVPVIMRLTTKNKNINNKVTTQA